MSLLNKVLTHHVQVGLHVVDGFHQLWRHSFSGDQSKRNGQNLELGRVSQPARWCGVGFGQEVLVAALVLRGLQVGGVIFEYFSTGNLCFHEKVGFVFVENPLDSIRKGMRQFPLARGQIPAHTWILILFREELFISRYNTNREANLLLFL